MWCNKIAPIFGQTTIIITIITNIITNSTTWMYKTIFVWGTRRRFFLIIGATLHRHDYLQYCLLVNFPFQLDCSFQTAKTVGRRAEAGSRHEAWCGGQGEWQFSRGGQTFRVAQWHDDNMSQCPLMQEMEVIPDLVMSGALAHLDTLHVDWHKN